MKILWFCSTVFSEEKISTTGTWLHTMSKALVAEGVELYNIAPLYGIKEITKSDFGDIKQWILPILKLRNGLPSKQWINKIKSIVDDIHPDLIHYWGIEYYFPLLYSRGILTYPSLLEIQGIKETCVRVFYGNLSNNQLLRCHGIKEILFPSLSLICRKRQFEKWSVFEREMLNTHLNISTHSEWVRAWVSQFKSESTNIYHTHRIVRKEFREATPWAIPNNGHPILFTISAGADAYKGIHDGIMAIRIVKQLYPDVELRIAGNFEAGKKWYRRNGYTNYLFSLIKRYGLSDNVTFVGKKSAIQLVEEMKNANVMLQLSYVETYSLAVAEALTLGIPAVVAYSGATPELIGNSGCSLFYTPSDYFMCAHQIIRILESPALANNLSSLAKESRYRKTTPEGSCKNQIDIYKHVLGVI